MGDLGVFYDRLSRFILVWNFVKYGDPYASFTMHRRLNLQPNGVDDIALSSVDLPGDPRVLDAGCGFGGTIFRWHELMGGRYDGVTVSRVQLAVAQREARQRGINTACRFYLKDYDGPFIDSYDAVVAIESLLYSENLGATVGRLSAALKPGGYLVVVDDVLPDKGGPPERPEQEALRRRWLLTKVSTENDYRMAIRGNNLRLIHEEDLTDQVDLMNPRSLQIISGICQFLCAAVPVSPVRTVLSAQMGGLILQRWYVKRTVRYKMFIGRKISGQD